MPRANVEIHEKYEKAAACFTKISCSSYPSQEPGLRLFNLQSFGTLEHVPEKTRSTSVVSVAIVAVAAPLPKLSRLLSSSEMSLVEKRWGNSRAAQEEISNG